MLEVLREIVARASLPGSDRISPDDVIGWSGSLENSEFYNAVSLDLAREYHAGNLSYTVCDGIINDLWKAAKSGAFGWGQAEAQEPFYGVYLAFDAGEYYRTADRSDDPVALYTDPLIAEIVLEYASSNIPMAGWR